MDLWIRSQDKENLIKATGLRVLDNHIQMRAECSGVLTIGTYATKERALEVLDDIESFLYGNTIPTGLVKTLAIGSLMTKNLIYEMPKE